MCFSAYWLFATLARLVVICGIVAILMIVIPWVLSWLGNPVGAMVMQIIKIIVAVIVLVTLIWFVYDLWSCSVGGGHALLR